MIRVLIADDHAMFRDGLKSKFATQADFSVAGDVGSGEEVLAFLRRQRVDVITLDVKLPDGSGVTLMKRIKGEHPGCKVVILTMYDHVRYALHALENGADGFVVKGSAFEELAKAVRSVMNHQTYVSSDMAPKLADRFRSRKPSVSLDLLSEREFEVLTALSQGLSVKETAHQLGVSEKTVTTYRSRIMEKLNISNRAELIRLAIEAGLVE